MQSLFVTPPSPLLSRKPFPTNPKDLAELSEKVGRVANEYLLAPKQLTTVRSLPRCENCLSNLPTAAQLVSELIEASSAVFFAATRQTSASARFATYSADLSGLHGLMNGGLLTGASVDWYPARVGGHQLCLCSGKLLLAARPALEAANSLFNDRFMQGALEHYTAGLLWTPCEPVLPADAPPEALMNKSALAYGNRSVVYHRLRQWEATIADVDRAIALGHGPLKKRSLLVKRKMECLLNLNRITEAEALFREHEREQETYEAAQRAKAAEAKGDGEPPAATAVTLLQQFQWQRLKAATEHGHSSTYPTEATVDGGRMATVAGAIAVLQAKGLFEGGQSKAPLPPLGLPRWLSRKLQFKKEEEEEEGGKQSRKYLIALEPIAAGEVLAVVKPLALVPLQAAHFGGTDSYGSLGARRCDHCQSACFLSPVSVETLRGRGKRDQNGKRPLLTSTKPPLLVRMPTPVPCTVCSQALYCGERCRDEAWAAYHRWECRLHSGQLAEKLAEPEVRLALRLLLAAGDVQALKEIATTLEAAEEGETEEGEEEDFNYRLEYEKLVTSSGDSGGFNGPPGPARGTLTEEWAKMFTASLLVQLLKACNFYEVGSSLSYL